MSFVEYKQFRSRKTGRFLKKRKLPPFTRYTLAWDIKQTPIEGFKQRSKGLVFVIVSTTKLKSSTVKAKLETFMAEQLEEHIGNWNWTKVSEGFEIEQISHNEISPAQLYRMYFYLDDEKLGSKRLYRR